MLQSDFEITFFCIEVPKSFEKEMVDNDFGFIRINSETQFIENLDQNQIVILDGYHFDTTYQKQIKAKDCKLVCIDDLHDKEFVADLIINHTPGVKVEDYKAQPYTRFALGLDYALLRPAFLQQAAKPRKIEKIETLLICFGGSDPKNLTQNALEVALGFQQFKKIIVVTGGAYNMSEDFQFLLKKPRIEYHHNLNDISMMAVLMEAELAIVPASGILFEAIAAECIVITTAVVDNQKNLYKGFSGFNFVIGLKEFSNQNLKSKLDELLIAEPPVLLQPITNKVNQNFQKIFNELLLELRNANINDAKVLFEWVNDPTVRNNSFKKELIDWDEHISWFTKRLDSPNCKIFILTFDSVSVGQIRFDIGKDGFASIDYSIIPKYRGRGFGKSIIQLGMNQILGSVKRIEARVELENIASNKVFESLGFVKKKIILINDSFNEFVKEFSIN
jgi:spore coat polysaccharide biosynthesis predicted glycosyltransferase SpsG/RimJ/RimL family protein N-acetyltransferase